ncbi:MAG: hypothetical protein WBG38_09555 [Nodosilinea sp.]
MKKSTGTAFTIAAASGDAGQMGMVAGSDRFSRIKWLHKMGNLDQSDRHWRFSLELGQTLDLELCLAQGDRPRWILLAPRIGRRYFHSFSQHFVSQH